MIDKNLHSACGPLPMAGAGLLPPGERARDFFERATLAFDKARLQGAPLAFLRLEIDDLAHVNAHYGQRQGLRVLRRIAERGRLALRHGDLFRHLEGETFAAVLNGCPPDMAAQVAERLHQTIHGLSFDHDRQHFSITLSLGLASLGGTDLSLQSLALRAQNASREAKHLGGNRIALG